MDTNLETKKPNILILATLSGGYAGADAVGQLHADYPANTYVLPVLCPSMFPPEFYIRAFKRGIDGIIVPDLPPDEGLELEAMSYKQNIDLIYLLAPTSTEERIEMVTQRSRGFIYLVSITGTTGTRENLATNLDVLVTRIKSKTSKPVCVGFGISTPEQARKITRVADGVIIGSKIIQLMQLQDGFTSICGFIKEMRRTLDEV